MATYMKDESDDNLRKRKSELEFLKEQGTISKKQSKELHDLEKIFENELNIERKKNAKELHEEERKAILEAYTESGDIIGAAGEKLKQSLEDAVDSFTSGEMTKKLTSQLDTIINSYVEKQTSMTAHLIGTNTSLSDITDVLSKTLSTSSLVKQEDVYNRLNTLLSNGITYNVEQRAFLQTLADDIDITFNATNGTLTQLIRLQRDDLTANRLSIEYSLQEFLNQNYNTSEYIKEAFTNVSDALLTSESLFTNTNAMNAYEATVQSWLGSYYSSGVSSSTVNSLATAINALGSGDISNIGTGISNLVLMGVAKAGLDYGELLTNGISAGDVDDIMVGITSYLTDMGANSSNVVKSQLSSLFGVSISDLVAMNNVQSTTTGSVSSNIYDTLLSDYDELVPIATKKSNVLSNIMYSWGANVASSEWSYIAYELEKLVASSGIGDLVSSMNFTGSELLGTVLNNATLISLFTSDTLSDWMGSIGNLTNSSALATIFNALGNTSSGSSVKISGSGVSESTYVGNGSSSDILNSYNGSANDAIGDTIDIAPAGPTTDENISTITDSVASIYDLLNTKLNTIINKMSSSDSSFNNAIVSYNNNSIIGG